VDLSAGCRSARSGLAAIFVTAIAAFNQSLSPKSSHAAIRLGWTHRLGRSVKARRFADREQGDFVVAAPGALASDTPLVEVKALLRSAARIFPAVTVSRRTA
jgi:hypothetical protein